MIGKNIQRKKYKEGFTLFIAMIVMGVLLLIAAGVAGLAVRQAFISYSARESQFAFYAADTGIECALYWDIGNPSGTSAFATTTAVAPISCNGQSATQTRTALVNGSATSTFSFTLSPDPYCSTVTINKRYVGSSLVTKIESLGYNTCSASNPRRVERAVRATY